MVRGLIRWSVHNPLVVILIAVAWAVVGLYAFWNVNVEAYPDPAPAIVEVVAQFPGASAQEVERQVSVPLEVAFAGMPGLTRTRSKSLFGLAHIRNQFEYGRDFWEARQEVINRLSILTQPLPAGVVPQISPQNPIGEIYRYTLKNPKDRFGNDIYTLSDLKTLQDWVLEREFRRVPHIMDVTSTGGTVKRYEIYPDPDRMKRYGVTLGQLQTALTNSNQNVGADLLMQGHIALNVRSVGLYGGGLDPVEQVLGMDKLVVEAYQDACLAEAAHVLPPGRSRSFWPLLAEHRIDETGRKGASPTPAGLAPSEEDERRLRALERLLRRAADAEPNPAPAGQEEEQVEALRRLRAAVAGQAVIPPLGPQEHDQVEAVRRILAAMAAPPGRTVELHPREQEQVDALRLWIPTRSAAIIRGEENRRVEEIRHIVIATVNNVPVKIDNIVEGGPVLEGEPLGVRGVVVGHQTRLGRVSLSKPAELQAVTGLHSVEDEGKKGVWRDENDKVQCIVLLRVGDQTLPAVTAVKEKVADLNTPGAGRMLPGVQLEPYYDRSDLTHVTTETVVENLITGIVLVILVLLMFLSNVRTAVIVAINVPLALLFAVSLLYFRGKSANLLSLGAVDFGIIVDSSVIMVENIYRHLATGEAIELPLRERIVRFAKEIDHALFFSTAIMVCAFIPLFTMSGPEGQLFGPMAQTYAFALAGALVLALTLTPVMCLLFFRHFQPVRENFLVRFLKGRYIWQLKLCLKYRWTTIFAMLALIIGSACLIPSIGREFMPQLEEGNFWITAMFPLNVSLDRVAEVMDKARAVIANYPEVEVLVPAIGRPDDGTDPTGFYRVEIFAPLKPKEDWPKVVPRTGFKRWLLGDYRIRTKEELTLVVNKELRDRFPGIDWNFSQYIRDNVTEALAGVKGDNSIKIFGPDLDRLEDLADKTKNILTGIRGIQEVGIFSIMGQPNLEFRVDLAKCAQWGVSAADVNNLVQSAVGGKALTSMIEGEKLFDVTLRWPLTLRNSETSILDMQVDISNNQVVPITGPGWSPSPTGSGLAAPSITGSLTNTANPISSTPRLRLRDLVSPVGKNGAADRKGTFERAGASTIYREQGKRMIAVKFNIRGRDLAGAVAEAKEKTNHLWQSPYFAVWDGEFNEMEKAEGKLKIIIPLSLGLIFIMLYMAFHSFLDAIVILTNVFDLAIGGIWALYLTGTHFSISAAVGFVSLFGVAIMEGLLMISYFNALRAQGHPLDEAIIQGAAKRVRPVMITAMTAILGLLPAALALRPVWDRGGHLSWVEQIGSQTQQPLAIVVVGGMIMTLFLDRYLMPVLYSFYGHREVAADAGSMAH
jgi:cobalt-zinc-cadmium resistance protein CzcA